MKVPASLAGGMLLFLLGSSTVVIGAQAPAPSSSSATTCLNPSDIQRTEVQDDRTILFHMRNGKVWVNKLRRLCPMLTTSPWTQVLHTGQICANQQFIHVARTGDTCALGDFSPADAAR